MSQPVNGESGEWRLGHESEEQARARQAEHEPKPLPARDLSVERLNRPLYVLTAEHLGWMLVLLWTLATRLVDLGARPMAESEARRALAALGMHPGLGQGWFGALQSGLLRAAGASDSLARLPAALFGLVLVCSALALRRDLGRAGALTLGAILALSPSVTYFSRSDSAVVPTFALTIVAIALLCRSARNPGRGKAIALAAAVALALSADPVAIPAAAALAAVLAILGIRQTFVVENAAVMLRVWWERRRGLLIAGLFVAIALFYVLETALFTRSFLGTIAAEARQSWAPGISPDFRSGVAFYLPEFVFYEFLPLILTAVGALAFVAFRLRSKLSAAAFLWMAASAAFYLWTPMRRPEWILAMLVPAAILGASAVDWLHHSRAWRLVRYPIVALALLTLYVQVLNNFVRIAPDPTEAPWARHALLYWTEPEPATTAATPEECAHALQAIPQRSSAFFELKAPELQWYLRSLKVAAGAESASVIVSPPEAPKPPNAGETWQFTFRESWRPELSGLDAARALRYFLTARTWEPMKSADVRLGVAKSVGPPAPTMIYVPHPQASPSPAAAAAASPSPTRSLEASPTASPEASQTASPEVSPAPTPSSTMTASPEVTPTPAPEASPTITPSAPESTPSVSAGKPAAIATPVPQTASVTPTPRPSPEPGKGA